MASFYWTHSKTTAVRLIDWYWHSLELQILVIFANAIDWKLLLTPAIQTNGATPVAPFFWGYGPRHCPHGQCTRGPPPQKLFPHEQPLFFFFPYFYITPYARTKTIYYVQLQIELLITLQLLQYRCKYPKNGSDEGSAENS